MFLQRRTSDFQMSFVTTALLPCGNMSGRNQYITGKNNQWLFYEILNLSHTEQSVESLNRNNKKINSLSVSARQMLFSSMSYSHQQWEGRKGQPLIHGLVPDWTSSCSLIQLWIRRHWHRFRCGTMQPPEATLTGGDGL